MSISVSNISAMRALATSSFVDTNVVNTVYVETVGDFFRFVRGSALTPSNNFIVASSDGLGQWFRMGIPNPTYLSALFWAVDPISGNDENLGWGATRAAADAVPLRTLAELDRRLIGNPGYRVRVTFHILNSVTEIHVMQNITTDNANGGKPMFVGALTSPLTTGVVSGYTAAVPATNTPYSVNLTSAASYIGKILVDEDNRYCFVLGAASANVAHISIPMYEQHGSVDTAGIIPEPGDLVNGKAFSVYSLPTLAVHPFRPTVEYARVIQLDVQTGSLASFSAPDLGGTSTYYEKSIISGGLAGSNGTSGSFVGGSMLWSGCLFKSASYTAGNGVGFIKHGSIFHACTVLNANLFFMNGSGCRLQEAFLLYNAGVSLDETSRLGGVYQSTPRLTVGIVNSTAASAFSGGTVRLPSDGGTVYGSGNTGTLFNIPQGASWSLPKAGCTATTSGAVLSVGGTTKAFSDIPFVNTTNNASITDGP